MDVEKAIAGIEWLEHIFSLPKTRPRTASTHVHCEPVVSALKRCGGGPRCAWRVAQNTPPIMWLSAAARRLGNIMIGENCRIGAGSVVLRDVPEDSMVVGVPGNVILRDGKRVVITDPKQISDPLSDALVALALEVQELRIRVQVLETTERASWPPTGRCLAGEIE